MKKKITPERAEWVDYYEHTDILDEILEEPVEFSLDERLCRDILSKKRERRLENVTIKMDPFQVKVIRKLATTKSIPYQTLIRYWLSEKIKQELKITK